LSSRKLLFFVTENRCFVSHRVPLAVVAKAAGCDVSVVTRVLGGRWRSNRRRSVNVLVTRVTGFVGTALFATRLQPAGDRLAEFRRVNAAASEKLARDAAAAGIRRLVYISSIKVSRDRA
jgi:hypothetical protein